MAAWAAVTRLAHPRPVTNLLAVAVAALIGFTVNELVARYRIRVGRQIGWWARPMVTPMASSSRLMLIPRPISANPGLAVRRLAFPSSSWSLASSIQAPIAATAAPAT